MSKHTEGPWSRDSYGNVVDSNGNRVSLRSFSILCSGDREAIGQAEANTDLSTAAPDLLEALMEERRIRLLGQQPDIHWESLRDARRSCYAKTDAAIARARGEV